jgi:hypothetical protein
VAAVDAAALPAALADAEEGRDETIVPPALFLSNQTVEGNCARYNSAGMRTELERARRSELASAAATAKCEQEKAEMMEMQRQEAVRNESLLEQAKRDKQRAEAAAGDANDRATRMSSDAHRLEEVLTATNREMEDRVASISQQLADCNDARRRCETAAAAAAAERASDFTEATRMLAEMQSRSADQQLKVDAANERNLQLQATLQKKVEELSLLEEQKARMEEQLLVARAAQREAEETTRIEREKTNKLGEEKRAAEESEEASRVIVANYEEAIRDKEKCRVQLRDQGNAITVAEGNIRELQRQLANAVTEKVIAEREAADKQEYLADCQRKLAEAKSSQPDEGNQIQHALLIQELEREKEQLLREAEAARVETRLASNETRRLAVLERNLRDELRKEIEKGKEDIKAEMKQYALLAHWTGSDDEIKKLVAHEVEPAQFGSRIDVYKKTAEAMQRAAEYLGCLKMVKGDLRDKCLMISNGQTCAECADLDGKPLAKTIKLIARHARQLHGQSGETRSPSATKFLKMSQNDLKGLQRTQPAAPAKTKDADRYGHGRERVFSWFSCNVDEDEFSKSVDFTMHPTAGHARGVCGMDIKEEEKISMLVYALLYEKTTSFCMLGEVHKAREWHRELEEYEDKYEEPRKTTYSARKWVSAETRREITRKAISAGAIRRIMDMALADVGETFNDEIGLCPQLEALRLESEHTTLRIVADVLDLRGVEKVQVDAYLMHAPKPDCFELYALHKYNISKESEEVPPKTRELYEEEFVRDMKEVSGHKVNDVRWFLPSFYNKLRSSVYKELRKRQDFTKHADYYYDRALREALRERYALTHTAVRNKIYKEYLTKTIATLKEIAGPISKAKELKMLEEQLSVAVSQGGSEHIHLENFPLSKIKDRVAKLCEEKINLCEILTVLKKSSKECGIRIIAGKPSAIYAVSPGDKMSPGGNYEISDAKWKKYRSLVAAMKPITGYQEYLDSDRAKQELMSIAHLDEIINSALHDIGADPINANNYDEMKGDVSHLLIWKVRALTQEAEVFRVRLMYEIAKAAFNERTNQVVESYLTFFDDSDSIDPVDRAHKRTYIVPRLLDKASKVLVPLMVSYDDAKRKRTVDVILDSLVRNRKGMYAKILAEIGAEESVPELARKVEDLQGTLNPPVTQRLSALSALLRW